MIKELKHFITKFDTTPTLEDLQCCYTVAVDNDCMVDLIWRTKWSGEYHRYIDKDTNIDEMYKGIKRILYGL